MRTAQSKGSTRLGVPLAIDRNSTRYWHIMLL